MIFELSPGELAKVAAWSAEQDEKVIAEQKKSDNYFIRSEAEAGRPYYGAISGELTYSFTPTGLGIITKVSHAVTNETLDVTDYESW